MNTYQKIKETTEFLLEKGIKPDVAIIIGTGLGEAFVKAIDTEQTLDYKDIPNFPISTVEFHSGKLIYGSIYGKKVLAFHGRFHYYEGYSMDEICLPVRIAKTTGAKYLLMSNAAGCLNPEWQKGDLMLIEDHINLQPSNPLIGQNNPELGPRFPDMIEPYNKELNARILTMAEKLRINIRKGVYASVTGPMLETRAEYRYLRTIGADAVGMSTVPEIIAAVHSGIPACAVSILTDECDPDKLSPVNIPEIIQIAARAEPQLTKIFINLINELNV